MEGEDTTERLQGVGLGIRIWDLRLPQQGYTTYHSKDTRLRRVDNGRERRNSKHAEVGDGKCAALVFVRQQLAVAGFSRQILDLL